MVNLTPDYPSQSPVTGGEAIHHARWREVLDDLMSEQATAGADPVLAYGYGDVPGYDDNPGKKPRQHWQLAVTRDYVEGSTMAGRQRRIRWTLETLAVAEYEDEARAMRDRLHTLRNRPVPFGHGSVLRLAGENNIDRLPGAAGYWGGLTTWNYATRP